MAKKTKNDKFELWPGFKLEFDAERIGRLEWVEVTDVRAAPQGRLRELQDLVGLTAMSKLAVVAEEGRLVEHEPVAVSPTAWEPMQREWEATHAYLSTMRGNPMPSGAGSGSRIVLGALAARSEVILGAEGEQAALSTRVRLQPEAAARALSVKGQVFVELMAPRRLRVSLERYRPESVTVALSVSVVGAASGVTTVLVEDDTAVTEIELDRDVDASELTELLVKIAETDAVEHNDNDLT
jgi:hypothetical protein